MTPELQSVVDQVEALERQNRSLRRWSQAAILLAVAAIAAPFILREAPKAGLERARYSEVAANRFLLRDRNGVVAGGMEVEPSGTIKLVLGSGSGARGAAFIEVQKDGPVVTLRGPDGGVRVALLGTPAPSVSLSPQGQRSSAAMTTLPNGSGELFLTDAEGRRTFRAP